MKNKPMQQADSLDLAWSEAQAAPTSQAFVHVAIQAMVSDRLDLLTAVLDQADADTATAIADAAKRLVAMEQGLMLRCLEPEMQSKVLTLGGCVSRCVA